MADQQRPQDWLEDLRREISAVISQSPAAAVSPGPAREAFEDWWRAEKQSPEAGRGRASEEKASQGAEASARLDRLSEDMAALREQVSRLAGENGELLRNHEKTETERSELAAGLSRSRSDNEAQLSRLENQARILQEQNRGLGENRDFLEGAFKRLDAEHKGLQQELRLEREKGSAAGQTILELRRKAAEQELNISRLLEENAAQGGRLEELGRQASLYQERLVRAKELTDSDIILLRQELKLFMEEIKIIRNSLTEGRGS